MGALKSTVSTYRAAGRAYANLSPKTRVGINAGINAGFMAADYRGYRKNGYRRQGAFATAATSAGVGSLAGLATRNIPKARYAVPATVALSIAGDALVTQRVANYYNPRRQRRPYYTRRVRGKVQRVKYGKRH